LGVTFLERTAASLDWGAVASFTSAFFPVSLVWAQPMATSKKQAAAS
jgi:hypothetical protein